MKTLSLWFTQNIHYYTLYLYFSQPVPLLGLNKPDLLVSSLPLTQVVVGREQGLGAVVKRKRPRWALHCTYFSMKTQAIQYAASIFYKSFVFLCRHSVVSWDIRHDEIVLFVFYNICYIHETFNLYLLTCSSY